MLSGVLFLKLKNPTFLQLDFYGLTNTIFTANIFMIPV